MGGLFRAVKLQKARERSQTNGAEDDLQSWKAIADFLQVTERTAQNWERLRAMPVRRAPGARGRVSASSRELAEWRESNLIGPSIFRNLKALRVYSLVITIVFLVLLVLVIREIHHYYWGRATPPQQSQPVPQR